MKCFKVIGLDRDGGTCECCGKDNLKKLVILREVTEEGDGALLRFGTQCAAKAAKYTHSAASIETAAKNATEYAFFKPVVIGKKPAIETKFFGGPW